MRGSIVFSYIYLIREDNMKKLLLVLFFLTPLFSFAQLKIDKANAREGGLVSAEQRAEYVFNLIKDGSPQSLGKLDNYFKKNETDIYLTILHYDKRKLTQTLPIVCYAVDQGLVNAVKVYLRNGVLPTYECQILSHSKEWQLTSKAKTDGWFAGVQSGFRGGFFIGSIDTNTNTKTLESVTDIYHVRLLDFASGEMFGLLWKYGFRSESLFKDVFLKEALLSGKKEVAGYIWENRDRMETSNPLLKYFISKNDFKGAADYLADRTAFEKSLLDKNDAEKLSLFIISEPDRANAVLKELLNAEKYVFIKDVFNPSALSNLTLAALSELDNSLSGFKAKPVWTFASQVNFNGAENLAAAEKAVSGVKESLLLRKDDTMPGVAVKVQTALMAAQNAETRRLAKEKAWNWVNGRFKRVVGEVLETACDENLVFSKYLSNGRDFRFDCSTGCEGCNILFNSGGDKIVLKSCWDYQTFRLDGVEVRQADGEKIKYELSGKVYPRKFVKEDNKCDDCGGGSGDND